MTAAAVPRGAHLAKTATGIVGLDEILAGGLPRGRPTLVCGSAGCGKTLLSMEFLIRGAACFDEPGVFVAFEETEAELTENLASLGFDVADLVAGGKLALEHIELDRDEIVQTGKFDLDGLFIRLEWAIDSIGAKRIVLDTVEAIFSYLPDPTTLRAELRRLFRWLKDKGVTAIITGERGQATLTRQGLEEYVSDCVIQLDHRITADVSTRRLRVVKYRGSSHGHNEYPFLIAPDGIWVMPVTSAGMSHDALEERVSTGVPRLDNMLAGGWHRGSTVLISGTAGTGKSSIAATFARAACERGERVQYFAFEESPRQIVRNMRSIGVDLQPWMDRGLLDVRSARPAMHGLEMHLGTMIRLVDEFAPAAVIVDPVSAFGPTGSDREICAMFMRFVDHLKSHSITGILTNLVSGQRELEATEIQISSLIDTWLMLRDIEIGGERNRGMYVLKARGTPHSNQIREFVLSDGGIDLVDVYTGPAGVLTGSARLAKEAAERASHLAMDYEIGRLRGYLERRRLAMEARVATIRAEFEADEIEASRKMEQLTAAAEQLRSDRLRMAAVRRADDDDNEVSR